VIMQGSYRWARSLGTSKGQFERNIAIEKNQKGSFTPYFGAVSAEDMTPLASAISQSRRSRQRMRWISGRRMALARSWKGRQP